jgi:hypothetical protein
LQGADPKSERRHGLRRIFRAPGDVVDRAGAAPLFWVDGAWLLKDPMSLPPDTQVADEPRGIGGWLILPAIGIVLTPIALTVGIITDILPVFGADVWPVLTTPGSPAYHPLWKPLIIFELVADLLLVAVSIYLLVLFFGKKRRLPKVMIAWLVAMVVVQVVDMLLAMQIPAAADTTESSDYRDLIRSVIACAIWAPYFAVSRRVKNTFVG